MRNILWSLVLKRFYLSEIPLANGSIVKVPSDCLPDINISEEVNKSGVWKSLEANSNSSGSIKGGHEDSSKLNQK